MDSTPGSATAAGAARALRYPLRGAPLTTNLVYAALRLVAAHTPIYGPLLHGLLTLGFYRYAFECMAAGAHGRAEAPELAGPGDEDLHRRHLLLQFLWLVVLVVAIHFVPAGIGTLLLATVALMLPGALLALMVAQNLLAALDPRNWWEVATRVGPRYLLLALGAFAVLELQSHGARIIDAAPWRSVALFAFYLAVQHLTLSLFHALGLTLRGSAAELAFQPEPQGLPPIERDREQAAQAEARAAARALADPAARVEALAALLRDGGDQALHREYRGLLRQLGRREALAGHARVHACELVAIGRFRPALALAREALDDEPDFTLPEAEPLGRLLDAAERAGLWRQSAALAGNYVRAHPRRYDTLPFALRAARLWADRLDDAARARELLEAGARLADGSPDAAEFQRLRARLDAGLPLDEFPAAR